MYFQKEKAGEDHKFVVFVSSYLFCSKNKKNADLLTELTTSEKRATNTKEREESTRKVEYGRELFIEFNELLTCFVESGDMETVCALIRMSASRSSLSGADSEQLKSMPFIAELNVPRLNFFHLSSAMKIFDAGSADIRGALSLYDEVSENSFFLY